MEVLGVIVPLGVLIVGILILVIVLGCCCWSLGFLTCCMSYNKPNTAVTSKSFVAGMLCTVVATKITAR